MGDDVDVDDASLRRQASDDPRNDVLHPRFVFDVIDDGDDGDDGDDVTKSCRNF